MPQAIFLMGPTASGKTRIAAQLVKHFPCEIISVDSAQVYRGMDIGTAKPDAGLLAQAPHHLIDIIDPTQSYSAARFRTEALQLMSEISGRGRIPLLAGGTMLYFKALKEGLSDMPQADAEIRAVIDALAAGAGWEALHKELQRLDPVTAARLQPRDTQRIQRALEVCYITGQPMSSFFRGEKEPLPYEIISVALVPSQRGELHQRIARRFESMLDQGLVKEVKALRERYALRGSLPSMRCVGYRQVWRYLEGEYDADQLREKGIAATRQFAKRQMTWLRAMPDVKIFDCLDEEYLDKVSSYLENRLSRTGSVP